MNHHRNDAGFADDPEGYAQGAARVAPGRVTLTGRMGPSAGAVARALRGDTTAATSAPPSVQLDGGRPVLDDPFALHTIAAAGVTGTGGELPHLASIQRSFGHHDVTGVRAHVGGAAAEAAVQIGADAYATGDQVAFAGAPDLRQAAHEAAHVVQQRGGVQLDGGVGQAGDVYEHHADAVADLVVRGESAAALLDTMAAGGGGRAAVQRWQTIGTEEYRPGLDRLIGETPVTRISVDVGTEAEWRRALARAGENAHLISFLRAAYVPAEGFAAHAAAHMVQHPALRLATIGAGLPLRSSRELSRVPTHEERMRLAKALYLRREWQMAEHLTEGLLPRLVDECQPDLLDATARGGHTISPGEAERAGGLAGRDGAEHMVASAGGSLLQAIAGYLAADSDRVRLERDALIRQAGYVIRGAVDAVDAADAADRASYETLVDGVVATVLGSLPGPVPRLLRMPARSLARALVDAMSNPASARARLERIHRGATELITGFDYARAGMDDAARLGHQRALRSAVDSAIM
jgi:hypothetical protein